MNYIRNKKGNILPYILMILFIIGIFVTVLLRGVSASSLAEIHRDYEKKTLYLAQSGMDAFIDYLNAYQSYQGKVAYIEAYPGKGMTDIKFPEGNLGQVKLSYESGEHGDLYAVTIEAIMGDTNKNGKKDPDERFFKSEKITYLINVGQPVQNPLLDPATPKGERGQISPESFGGGETGNTEYEKFFEGLIPPSFDVEISERPNDKIGQDIKVAVDQKIQESDQDEILVLVKGSVHLDTNLDFITNNPIGKKIILYVMGDFILNKGSVYMYGLLLVEGNIIVHNDETLSADHAVSNNDFELKNKGKALITGTLATKNFDEKGSDKFGILIIEHETLYYDYLGDVGEGYGGWSPRRIN